VSEAPFPPPTATRAEVAAWLRFNARCRICDAKPAELRSTILYGDLWLCAEHEIEARHEVPPMPNGPSIVCVCCDARIDCRNGPLCRTCKRKIPQEKQPL
jgi:hypothetical protein